MLKGLTVYFALIGMILPPVALAQGKIDIRYRDDLLSVDIQDAYLKDVFEKLTIETKIWFRANKTLLDGKISVSFRELSFQDGLKRILRSTNCAFIFKGREKIEGVIITNKKGSSSDVLPDYNDKNIGDTLSHEISNDSDLSPPPLTTNKKGPPTSSNNLESPLELPDSPVSNHSGSAPGDDMPVRSKDLEAPEGEGSKNAPPPGGVPDIEGIKNAPPGAPNLDPQEIKDLTLNSNSTS